MEVKSTDKIERNRVPALALPTVLHACWARLIAAPSISLLMRQRKHYLAHQVTPQIAIWTTEKGELGFVEHLLYTRQTQGAVFS